MNRTMQTRLLALFLAVVMVIGYVPTYAFATETEETQETTAAFVEETEASTEAEETETATEAATEESTEASEEATEEATEAATEEATEETTQPEEDEEYDFPDVDSMTDAELLAYYAGLSDEEAEAFALSLTDKQLERLSDLLYAVELCGESSDTHIVFKNTQSTLAPGVTQNLKFAYAADGKQMAYYIATADVTRDDVVVQTSYYKQHENGVMGMAKLTEQIEYANAKYTNKEDPLYISDYYNVVAGCNASFYNMSTGQPIGITYIDGVSFGTYSYDNFFAILKDGKTAVVDYVSNLGKYVDDNGESTIWQACGGSQWLVRDGKDVTAGVSGSYNTERHSRTCIGVTAEGKVVIMTLDGRQEPYSCGGTMHELAQIMLEAGCVAAINLDGGGSSTFVSKAAGSDSISVVNRPSDGSVRAISSGIIIASTAAPSNVFASAVLTAEEEYVTPKSTVNVTAVGVSPAGTSATVPADAIWQLADATMGTVENGVFTASEKTGDAVVQMVVGGQVVGETTIHVVIPDLEFVNATMVVPHNKTFELEVTGTTNNGLNKVKLKDEDLVFTLSDPAMGTIEGKTYTSCGEDAGITGGTITVACVYDTTKTATTEVTFGKASVIVKDFEDQDITGWSAKTRYAGTFGRFEKASLALVNKTTGKVRNGDYALALTADFTDTTASGYKAVRYFFPTIDLTGATAFGMWMYLPVQDIHNIEFDIGGYEFYPEKVGGYDEEGWYYVCADTSLVGDSVSNFTIYMTDPDETYFNIFNSYTIYVDDLTIDYSSATEDREIPLFTDVSVSAGTDSLEAMNGQTIYSNSFVVKATAQDDPTGNTSGLDLSTAKVYVNGKQLSSSAYICDDNGVISAEVTMGNGTHTFRFEISDNSGNVGFVTRQVVVNTAQAEVSVVRRDSDTVQPLAGSIVWFDVVAENAENVQALSLTMDLDTLNIWELQGAEAVYGYKISTGKNYLTNTAYVNLTRTEEATATGKTVLASLPVRTWQTTAYLNQTYIDAGVVTNSLSSAESTTVGTPYVMWGTDRTRLVRIELNVNTIQVTHASGNYSTYSQKQMNIITELNRYRSAGYYTESGSYVTGDTTFVMQGKTSTHTHTATALEDKAATCTESGYTGRTYCEVCDSVLTWGTKIAATGHTYEITDGVLKCHCGETFTGTWTDGREYVDGVAKADGWVGDSYYLDGTKLTGIHKVPAPDGSGEFYYDFGEDGISTGKYTGLFFDETVNAYRYAKIGSLASGWFMIDDEWYHFRSATYTASTGTYENYFPGVTYHFEETGKLTSGVWYTTTTGTRYYYGPDYYRGGGNAGDTSWITINGDMYCFDRSGNRYEGYRFVVESNSTVAQWYDFGTDGVLVGKLDYSGLLEVNGDYYGLENGISLTGLVQLNGYYYYFLSQSRAAVKGRFYTITTTNGLDFTPGSYEFDNEGHMIIKNGLVSENGGLYYYVNGSKTYAGLILIDGDYYYIRSNCQAVVGTTYYCQKTNDLLPVANYTFGADGKMVREGVTPTKKNGLVSENGGLYYYVDDVLTYAGLILIDDDYYYIRSNCQAVVGMTYYCQKTNDLLPVANYTFDAEGKMVRDKVDPSKNGLVSENGGLYYYVDGVKTYAGLILIDGDYYYIRSNCQAVVGMTYYCQKTNDLLPVANYTFDAEGKMVRNKVDTSKNGLVSENGGLYYYVDGVKTYAGLILIDGDYYYIRSNCQAVVGMTYYCQKTNDLLPVANYTFDAEGKMVRNKVDTSKNGLVSENGGLYYYVDGVKTYAGLILIDGDYYYIRSNCQAVVGMTYYCQKTNDLLPVANYTFDSEGKMVRDKVDTSKNGLVSENGGLYYYVDGVKTYAGLILIDGDYYYIRSNCQAVVGTTYYCQKTNGLLPVANYTFDSEGKMVR